jgi:hypothetical protein
MEQSKPTTKQTICWGCARSLLRNGVVCPWALSFQPVHGWTAIRNDIYANNNSWRPKRSTESYIVIKCPLFLSDADYNKKIKNKEENNMNQGINTSDATRMDRFDRNTKTAVNEITVKEKMIQLPAITEFGTGENYAAYLSRDGERLELVKDKDGYTVSGVGRGGVGRGIRCEVLCDAMKARGTAFPQTVPIEKKEDGKWVAELKKIAPVEASR